LARRLIGIGARFLPLDAVLNASHILRHRVTQCFQLCDREFAGFAFRQAIQKDRANGDAFQLQDFVLQFGEHPPNLAVLPFA
jgi:hypothetical protein